MTDEEIAQIQGMITDRLITFFESLVERGSIEPGTPIPPMLMKGLPVVELAGTPSPADILPFARK